MTAWSDMNVAYCKADAGTSARQIAPRTDNAFTRRHRGFLKGLKVLSDFHIEYEFVAEPAVD